MSAVSVASRTGYCLTFHVCLLSNWLLSTAVVCEGHGFGSKRGGYMKANGDVPLNGITFS